jgi:3-phenylpropionate/cinnamic acid dioxygenase small subunit
MADGLGARASALMPLILKLNAEYACAIDEDRLEDWPGFFDDDACLYSITSAENMRRGYPAGLMYADSKGMLIDRINALRLANVYEAQSYRHVVGVSMVRASDSETLRTETAFVAVRIMRDGRMDLFATGRYLDALVEVGGELRLRERIVVCDSSRVDTLLAIPL